MRAIRRYYTVENTIVEFANKNGLDIEFIKSDTHNINKRYIAQFIESGTGYIVWVEDEGDLESYLGEGIDEESALRDYAYKISNEILVILDYNLVKVKSIPVPILNKEAIF